MITRTLGALVPLFAAMAASAQDRRSTEDLASRMIERRAVEAVIWGMPAVNYNLMYQEMVRKVGGRFNQFFTGLACSTGRTRRSRRIPT